MSFSTNKQLANGSKNKLAGRDIKISNRYEQRARGISLKMKLYKELFDSLLRDLDSNQTVITDDGVFLRTKSKIELNFPESKEVVADYYNESICELELVRSAIQMYSGSQQKAVHSQLRRRYNELKLEYKEPLAIFHALVEYMTPREKQDDPLYSGVAQSIVLFFFEDCTLFEKTFAERRADKRVKRIDFSLDGTALKA